MSWTTSWCSVASANSMSRASRSITTASYTDRAASAIKLRSCSVERFSCCVMRRIVSVGSDNQIAVVAVGHVDRTLRNAGRVYEPRWHDPAISSREWRQGSGIDRRNRSDARNVHASTLPAGQDNIHPENGYEPSPCASKPAKGKPGGGEGSYITGTDQSPAHDPIIAWEPAPDANR